MKIVRKKKWMLVLAGSAVVLGGIADVYFSATGSGTSAAPVGEGNTLTISQTNTLSPLYPGAAAQGIDLSIDNPGSGVDHVNTVTITINAGSLPVGCSASWFPITDGAVNSDVNPGSTGFSSVTTGASIQMTAPAGVNQDACENASLTLDLSSN